MTVAPGGVIENVSYVEVGQTQSDRVYDNALVLAGGEVFANDLTVRDANRLDVVIGSSGVKPIVLENAANLVLGCSILPSMTNRSKLGVWYPIVKTKTGIITIGEQGDINNLLITTPGNPVKWKLRLSEDKTTLSICGSIPTLFMVR